MTGWAQRSFTTLRRPAIGATRACPNRSFRRSQWRQLRTHAIVRVVCARVLQPSPLPEACGSAVALAQGLSVGTESSAMTTGMRID